MYFMPVQVHGPGLGWAQSGEKAATDGRNTSIQMERGGEPTVCLLITTVY
jgi:hypothetical protein